jgi:hypothetical protein
MTITWKKNFKNVFEMLLRREEILQKYFWNISSEMFRKNIFTTTIKCFEPPGYKYCYSSLARSYLYASAQLRTHHLLEKKCKHFVKHDGLPKLILCLYSSIIWSYICYLNLHRLGNISDVKAWVYVRSLGRFDFIFPTFFFFFFWWACFINSGTSLRNAPI